MMITPVDDRLHPPTGNDPTWAETAVFTAAIPERGIGIWVYPLFRTSLGVYSCRVLVWGPDAEPLWLQPYCREWWHQPIPDDVDLTALRLPNGLDLDVIEPLRVYRVRFADGDAVRLDLEFTALQEPHISGIGLANGNGHWQQLSRVRGELVLHGEHLPVDCIRMRDRTWSPRREERDRLRQGYAWGAFSDNEAFLLHLRVDEEGVEHFMGGNLLRDGGVQEATSAKRVVTRDDGGRPERVVIAVTAEDGTTVEAEGRVVSRAAIGSSPPYFMWVSLVEWTTPSGATAWGEDQDVWSSGRLRRFLRGEDFA